jgi:hypothetical protein
VKEAKDFCRKYDAYVQDSSRMHRRAKRVDYKIWSESDADSFQEMFQTIPYQEVKCVEIHMPEDRFRALLEHDEWLETAGRQRGYQFANDIQRASHLVEQHNRETRIRHSNPAVQLAYEKYQMMLNLVDSHYD